MEDKLEPGPGLADADPETVEIVEREMRELGDDLFVAVRAAGGPLSDAASDPAKLEQQIDAVAVRMAERLCLRPRPVVFNRCVVFVSIVQEAGGRVGFIPALVRSDKLHAGFQALLAAAESHGRLLATLSIFTEPHVARQSRIAMASRSDHRGTTLLWAQGPLRDDGSAKLGEWSAERPAVFTGWGGERMIPPSPKDLLN